MSGYMKSTEDMRQRLRPFGLFFEKSLKDLIKGIRSHSESFEELEQFLYGVLDECRREASSLDMNLKTNAILKLAYLEMYGYDMSWANFHTLEVMSSDKLQQKRVGYLAASQSFCKDSDILMLATNLLRKDLKYSGSNDTVRVSIALSGLSTMVTSSLASNICEDLCIMLNSSKAYIRKKAVTALFKVFLEYPEALKDNFDRFTMMLEDEDTSVLSATVSVICELSKKIPEPFVPLSPLLYELLLNIDNNWIIIRLLKLFTNLSQIEVKLRPKLLPKILELMRSTSATSVLYESVNCLVKGQMISFDDYDTAFQCLEYLNTFCESTDPNLRFISCGLFHKIGKINPNFSTNYDKLVIKLLTDIDVSIRSKAIELLEGIVDEENLMPIVKILMRQLIQKESSSHSNLSFPQNEAHLVIPESYKIKAIQTIIQLCSSNNFELITDFECYNAVLADLSVIAQDLSNGSLGAAIAVELRNIMVRVPQMRGITISTIIKILSDDEIDKRLPSILPDTVWALGEYSSCIENGNDLMALLIKRSGNFNLETNKVLIPALVKLFSTWCNLNASDITLINSCLEELLSYLQQYSTSRHYELQERAAEYLELLKLGQEAMSEDGTETLPALLSEVLPSLFDLYELKPISANAQKRLQNSLELDVTTPFLSEKELNLIFQEDQYIEAMSISSEDLELYDSESSDESIDDLHVSKISKFSDSFSETKVNKETLVERQNNMFYLDMENKETPVKRYSSWDTEDVTQKNINAPALSIKTKPASVHSTSEIQKKKKKKKKHHRVLVLQDEDIVYPNNNSSDDTTLAKKPKGFETPSNKISFKPKSKLESFDFFTGKTTTSNSNGSELDTTSMNETELEELRNKFASHNLQTGTQGNTSDTDDKVIIIKKSRKKKPKRTPLKEVEEADNGLNE